MNQPHTFRTGLQEKRLRRGKDSARHLSTTKQVAAMSYDGESASWAYLLYRWPPTTNFRLPHYRSGLTMISICLKLMRGKQSRASSAPVKHVNAGVNDAFVVKPRSTNY